MELGAVEMENAWAYADLSDLPVLAVAGRPVVVNLDRRLRRVARDRQWPVLNL